MALLVYYLKHHACLGPFSSAVATLLPITLIIVTLPALNLDGAVFDVMAGLRAEGTASNHAYRLLVPLTLMSMLSFIPLLACYIALIAGTRVAGPEE